MNPNRQSVPPFYNHAVADQSRQRGQQALDAVWPEVYQELRRLAAYYVRGERAGLTLQPTALVHEAYVRLLREANTSWENRAHFCAIAANAMRQILVEQAAPRLTVVQPEPQVTVQRQQPEIFVRQPAPTVTVDIPQPEITVRMPPPTRQGSRPQIDLTRSRLSPRPRAASRSISCTRGNVENFSIQGSGEGASIARRSP